MIDIDLQLAHENARLNHDLTERIEGLRDAASLISTNLPSGEIKCDTFKQIAARLRKDATALEASIQ